MMGRYDQTISNLWVDFLISILVILQLETDHDTTTDASKKPISHLEHLKPASSHLGHLEGVPQPDP